MDSHIQDVFKERIERDVSRIMRHIVGSEMDATTLDGQIVLTIENGALVDVQFGSETTEIPVRKARTTKAK